MSLEILHSSADLVVVNKSSGWLSVPGREGAEDPRPVVGIELQKQLGRQIFPVHRLDFEVSGILIFALNPQSHRQLNVAFEKGQVRKTYQAFCEKKLPTFSPLPGESLVWQSKIVRGKKRSFFADHGKDSTTRARLEAKGEDEVSEWILEPLTGRPHQLRLELSAHGFPILGDQLYGASRSWSVTGGLPAIALRCIEMDLGGLPEPDFQKLKFSCAKMNFPAPRPSQL